MKQLIQKTLTVKKEILITEDGLSIKNRNIREEIEYKIKYEDLGFDLLKKKIKMGNAILYFFLFFILLNLGLLIDSVINHEPIRQQFFWLFALVFFSTITIAASYHKHNKDVIYLTGGQKTLELFASKPDSETVNLFIEDIHIAMRQYLKNKYSIFDQNTPYELKLNQLKWLKEIKALTDEEYKELLNDTKTDRIIGFQQPD